MCSIYYFPKQQGQILNFCHQRALNFACKHNKVQREDVIVDETVCSDRVPDCRKHTSDQYSSVMKCCLWKGMCRHQYYLISDCMCL
jgi:hypothetical protein